jgi:hypothetical protein
LTDNSSRLCYKHIHQVNFYYYLNVVSREKEALILTKVVIENDTSAFSFYGQAKVIKYSEFLNY